jgi:hypothetical protein
MSYLHYVCLFVYKGVQHTYCVVYLFCFSSSCVTCVALDCPFPNIYLTSFVKINSGEVYSIQQYAIKVVDNLRQVGGFLFGLQSFFFKNRIQKLFQVNTIVKINSIWCRLGTHSIYIQSYLI